MKNITIRVPDMQSAHCQARVSDVVRTIEGVQVIKLEAGEIKVSIENDQLRKEVVEEIEKAGYTVAPEDKEDA